MQLSKHKKSGPNITPRMTENTSNNWRDPSKETSIWVFYQTGDDPFIYAVEGLFNDYEDLNKELQENEFDYFKKGDGEYLFNAKWITDETGYWELDYSGFKSIEH